MLIVPSANLAFAHFPKTAGTSLARLLQDRFPDARYVDSADIRLDLAERKGSGPDIGPSADLGA